MTPAHDTRSQILSTGRRLTAQQGFTALGLGALLKEAGVPKGSFYHYFPSKEAYGCALLHSFLADYRARLGASLADPGKDARGRFLAYFDDWRRRQLGPNPEDRCLVVRLSAEVADLSAEMGVILQSAVQEIIALLTETLERGRQDGSIPAMRDPRAMAETVYHMWLGASLIAALSHSSAPLDSAMHATRALVDTSFTTADPA